MMSVGRLSILQQKAIKEDFYWEKPMKPKYIKEILLKATYPTEVVSFLFLACFVEPIYGHFICFNGSIRFARPLKSINRHMGVYFFKFISR